MRWEAEITGKRIALFHMLPSGGGIRVVRQFADGLADYFPISSYHPTGGTPLNSRKSIPEIVIPYKMWKKPAEVFKPVIPIFLLLRLLNFRKVCRKAAEVISREADAALVHNTMPVASPPILKYLSIPSAYFCFEYPRHIYEKDAVSRTGSIIRDIALKPLECIEKKIDFSSTVSADEIITFSTHMQRCVKTIYGKESLIIRPGIDSVFFSPDNKIKRENFVLSVGALWPFKGHEKAIRILSEIPGASRPSLMVVGDREFPGYSLKLRSIAEKLSVNMKIVKQISNDQLLALYRSAALVLCCQRREPYGLVPLEAMACGTPVLAVSEGGFTDNIVHGETGFLFDGSVSEGQSMLQEIMKSSEKTAAVSSRALMFVRQERDLASGITRLAEEMDKL